MLLPIGVLIGLLLGSVGGGGSLIAVPTLVYLGSQGLRSAQAGALAVVIAASSIGFATYLRRDAVRWRAGLAFGLAAAIGSFCGSLLSRQLNPNLLLLAFSPLMVAGALAMVSERGRSRLSFRRWRFGVSRSSVLEVTLYGVLVGMLTGLFGVGGGFVIVPVLVLGLGFGMPEAVGTSLLIIIISSLVAFSDRLGEVDWSVVGPFAGAAVLGVLAGSALGERARSEALARWFALLVVVAALYTAGDALAALL